MRLRSKTEAPHRVRQTTKKPSACPHPHARRVRATQKQSRQEYALSEKPQPPPPRPPPPKKAGERKRSARTRGRPRRAGLGDVRNTHPARPGPSFSPLCRPRLLPLPAWRVDTADPATCSPGTRYFDHKQSCNCRWCIMTRTKGERERETEQRLQWSATTSAKQPGNCRRTFRWLERLASRSIDGERHVCCRGG